MKNAKAATLIERRYRRLDVLVTRHMTLVAGRHAAAFCIFSKCLTRRGEV